MAEVSGYSLLTMSEIRVCNPVFRKILARIFSTGVCYEIDSKKFTGAGRIGRCPEGMANANESQHRIRHR